MTHEGIAKGKIIKLDEPLPYSEGQRVSVSVEPLHPELRPGSPLSILKVIQALPDIPKEDVDELKQLIEQGKLPVRMQGEFNSEGARVRPGKTFQDLCSSRLRRLQSRPFFASQGMSDGPLARKPKRSPREELKVPWTTEAVCFPFRHRVV